MTRGSLALAVLVLGASRSFAQPAEPEWLPLESVGGKVMLSPVVDLPSDVPETGAVHVEITPGHPFSGIVTNGTWFADALGPEPWEGVELRIRVLSGEPVTLTCLWPGRPPEDMRVLPERGRWQTLILPGSRSENLTDEPRLVLVARQACGLEVGGCRRSTRPASGVAAHFVADEMSLLRAVLRDDWGQRTLLDALDRAWADAFRADAAGDAGSLRIARAGERAFIAYCGRAYAAAQDAYIASLRRAGPAASDVMAAAENVRLRLELLRRDLALGAPRVGSERVLDLGNPALSSELVGPEGLLVRDGLLTTPWDSHLPPLPGWVTTRWMHGGMDEVLLGSAYVSLVPVTYADLEPTRGTLLSSRLRGLRETASQHARMRSQAIVVLTSPVPTWFGDLTTRGSRPAVDGLPPPAAVEALAQTLRALAGSLTDCPAFVGYAIDLGVQAPVRYVPQHSVWQPNGTADTRSTVVPSPNLCGAVCSDRLVAAMARWSSISATLADAVSSRAPGRLLFADPGGLDPQGGAQGLDWSFLSSCGGAVSNLGILMPPQSGLAARFASSAQGTGARRSGLRACDFAVVSQHLPGVAFPRLLQSTATSARPRIAVVASHVEVARRASNAPALLSLLAQMGVDAELLCDVTLRDDPRLQHRYKALLYETNSLDAEALKAVWSSGVPTLFVGRLNEDNGQRGLPGGAAAALIERSAFLKSPPVCWLEPSMEVARRPGGFSVSQDDPLGTLRPGWLAQWPRVLPELAGRGWRCVTHGILPPAELLPVDAARWAWWLRVPMGLPPQTEVLVNGQSVGRVDARLPRVDRSGNCPFVARLPAGLLKGTVADVLTARYPPDSTVGDVHRPEGSSVVLTCAAVRRMKPTADFGDLKVAEEYEYLTAHGQARLRDEIICSGVVVLARDAVTQAPVLLRQGNRLLWVGPDLIEHMDPVALRVVSSFLAMLGEAHAYPPQATGTNDVRESALGYVITRQTSDYIEANLGTNRALYAVLGDDLAWQRVGGDARSVVPLPAWHCAETVGLSISELEVRPAGNPVTITRLERDFCRPELLCFTLHLSGAAQLVLHTPFTTGTEYMATVDHTPQRLSLRGGTATLTVPAGAHDVRFEAFSRAIQEELTGLSPLPGADG